MNAHDPHPPRLANRLLHRLSDARWLEEIEGDLQEQFAAQAHDEGVFKARVVYWRDVLLFGSRPYVRRRRAPFHQARGPFMLTNYLKIALRTLRRHKGYAFINVMGLAVGVACCLLLLLFVRDELSYDRHHPYADRTYRVVMGQDRPTVSTISGPIGPTMKAEYPEVLDVARVFKYWSTPIISHGDRAFFETGFFFADPTVTDLFAFTFIQGDPATALAEPFSVLLTRSMALKYFGGADPIGQPLAFDVDAVFTVTGVVDDPPPNTHFRFDFVGSFSTLPALLWPSVLEQWTMHAFNTYVLLAPDASPAGLEAKLDGFFARHAGNEEQPFYLQPLPDIHLHSQLSGELGATSDIRYVYLLATLAGLLLLIACINYTNLATARTAQRAREVGLRKVVGAGRRQIALQFLGESMVMTILATGLALGLLAGALPAFNALTGKSLLLVADGPLVAGLVGVILLVGVLSGSYPALLLAAFRPVHVLKGRPPARSGAAWVRQGLVVFQFAAAIVLLVGTLVIAQQLDYIRQARLGFDQEQVVVLPVRDGQVIDRADALRNTLLRHPHILAVSRSTAVPSTSMPTPTVTWSDAGADERLNVFMNWVDDRFFPTLGLALVAGRAFSPDFPADSSEAVLLNETAVARMGWSSADEALDKTILRQGQARRVIGVVKDFHYRSLHEPIDPLAFYPLQGGFGYLSVRVRPDDLAATLAHFEQSWTAFSSEQPFSYFFLDEAFATLYQADEQWQALIRYAGLLVILLACLGLFGLAAFAAERRTQEIGVRKVLGASIPGIILLLSRDFAKLVGIAFLLAVPPAYLAMNRWLEGFAYHIALSWQLFLLAGLAALGIALLTVSYQSIKAALADPVQSLRHE